MLAAHDAELLPHDHVVSFYGDDAQLVDDLARFLGEGLDQRAAAVVVATEPHRQALRDALVARDVDVDRAIAQHRYVAVDAAETLAAFLVGGRPDRAAFADVVGCLLAAASGGDGQVRVFGEMVALLWEDGAIAAALELESLWNALHDGHDFNLHCAYALASVAAADDLPAASAICELHSEVRVCGPGGALHEYEPAAIEASRLFVPVTTAAREARHFVADRVRAWGFDAVADDAALVTSELATNAVLHASSPFVLGVRLLEGGVRISVRDTSPTEPMQPIESADAEGGRGVQLVSRIAARWGTESDRTGKTVWVELAAPAR